LGDERPIDDEVVEESFVGCRSDSTLRARKQVRHGCRHQVRGAVAQQRQRLGTLVGDDANGGILFERIREVYQLAVHNRGVRRLREPWGAPRRNVAKRRARRNTATRSVGKGNRDLAHWVLLRVAFARPPPRLCRYGVAAFAWLA